MRRLLAAKLGGWEVILLVVSVLLVIFWIRMLLDCARNERLTSNEKVVWILIIVFLHVLGALIYAVAGRKR